MKTTLILIVSLLGCADLSVPPADAAYPYFDVPCTSVHCTTVVCPDVGPCTCYWPPTAPIRCNGDGQEP